MSPFQGDTFAGKFCSKSASQSVASAGKTSHVTGCQNRYDLEEYVEIEVWKAPWAPNRGRLHSVVDERDGGGSNQERDDITITAPNRGRISV